MNKIVSFHLPDPPDPEIVQKIRSVSKPMEFIAASMLFGLGLLLILGVAALFFYEGPLLRIDETAVYVFFALEEIATAPHTTAIGDFSLYTRTGMFVIVFLQYGPLMMMLWGLKSLFARLKTHPVFDKKHAQILTHMGGWLIFFAVIPFFTDMIAELVGSPDRNWFKWSSIGAVFLGVLLMVLAQVMRHGGDLEQENASFF